MIHEPHIRITLILLKRNAERVRHINAAPLVLLTEEDPHHTPTLCVLRYPVVVIHGAQQHKGMNNYNLWFDHPRTECRSVHDD